MLSLIKPQRTLSRTDYNDFIEDYFDEVFGKMYFPSVFTKTNFLSSPNTDIEETESNFIVKSEMAGLSENDIKVSVEDSILTIKGERKEEKVEENEKKYHRKEIRSESFERRFTLPENTEFSKIEAKYKDGILEVVIPKVKKEEEKPKAINIEVKK